MKKYKYVILSPYFGKLPAMFDLWAQSCGYNKDMLFLVFTDDVYNKPLPENVLIKPMSFGDLQKLVQSKFDFPISLKTPYKLCDYKPAFGYIFQEYLQGCAYWGHCDMDLVFGNMAKFLPREDYDKISNMGHFCLYKNTPEILKAFMLSSGTEIIYKDVFSSSTHFGFDEDDNFGINVIFKKQNMSVYQFDNYVADISCLYHNFYLSHYQNPGFKLEYGSRTFEVKDGNVYGCSITPAGIGKQEYAYVHIQKRRLVRNFSGTPNSYLITPLALEPWQEITADFIKEKQINAPAWKNFKKILSIKRYSSPRALRRKLTIRRILLLKKMKRGKHL